MEKRKLTIRWVSLIVLLTVVLSGCSATTTLSGGLTEDAQLSEYRTACVKNGGTATGGTLEEFSCDNESDRGISQESTQDHSSATPESSEASNDITSTKKDKVSQTLPESYDEHTLSDMKVNQTAYTTPWGMWVDMDRKAWLHPGYTASSQPAGTASMKVERRKDGYHVWLVSGESYIPQSEAGYASPEDTGYIPVVALHE